MQLFDRNSYAVTRQELLALFRIKTNSETSTKTWLWLLGIVLAPVALMGALFGYARAYNLFYRNSGQPPKLANFTPLIRASMYIFAVLFFFGYWLAFYLLYRLAIHLMGTSNPLMLMVFVIGLVVHVIWCSLAFRTFQRWQNGINNMMLAQEKFGTARFAYLHELTRYKNRKGIFIGGSYFFNDKGHILTDAGTRGGKGTNLILPNLLGIGEYNGSYVVIDPKGENAAISVAYLRSTGKKVVLLNPWQLFVLQLGQSHSYNPLDILLDTGSIHLVDDIQMIAEMLVPINKKEADPFFTDNARSIVAGLLLHLMTLEGEAKTLTTLWQWVRYTNEAWSNLLADMAVNEDALYGRTIQNAANEILKLMQAGDRTFGSIIATVLQCTDFIKSPALQTAMQSEFSPSELADGNMVVFVVIPTEKLKSHARWLRLVVTSMMRVIVRKPNKQVTFILDEFAALGYLSEIEIALSTYAGFNITVWTILQTLGQLKDLYGNNWETFIANCTIRNFFAIYDNESANYVSEAMGQTSHVVYKRDWLGITDIEVNQRALLTPDEVRRGSGDNIFTFIGSEHPTYYPKLPYYKMPHLIDNGEPRYEPNPYIKNDSE